MIEETLWTVSLCCMGVQQLHNVADPPKKIKKTGPDLRGLRVSGPQASRQHRVSHQTVSMLSLANDRCALLIIVLVTPNLSWAPASHQLSPALSRKCFMGSITTTVVGIKTLSHCTLCTIQTLTLF